MNIYLYPL